ncbi:MAG: hypothetical protein H6569_14320 [Lewinellaceae bacterium]|nr:hypothetical protein [Lewinellaceae bacterium]
MRLIPPAEIQQQVDLALLSPINFRKCRAVYPNGEGNWGYFDRGKEGSSIAALLNKSISLLFYSGVAATEKNPSRPLENQALLRILRLKKLPTAFSS